MAWNQNASYGMSMMTMIANAVPAFGNVHVVFKSTDSDEANYQIRQDLMTPDNDGRVRFYSTLLDAYNACESNNNDIILLDANSTHAVSTGITWSKNRIHVFGMDGGHRRVQQGAKIELSGNVASAFVLKVTGTRNSFTNLKIIQSSTNAAALNVVQFAGEGNLWENCSFLFGVVDNLDLTTAAEALMGEDSGTFIKCSFGTDVLTTSAARNVMAIDAITGASSADGAKSNRFEDCEWIICSSEANAVLIKVVDTAAAKFINKWTDCNFTATVSSGAGGVAITNAIQSVASFVDGSLVFVRPTTANCTNGCATLTANVVVSGAPVFTANAWEGGTPS